jgi:hypothetical protein
MPDFAGSALKKDFTASSPPAEAPMPTTGNGIGKVSSVLVLAILLKTPDILSGGMAVLEKLT